MTPNNPPESAHQQQIVTIVDKDGVTHKVIPLNHTHSQSEVSGLTTALASKMDAKTIDSVPADNADHLVSSKGVYDALQNKADINSPASSITNGDGASVNFSQNGDVLITPKSGRDVAFMFNGSATAVSPSNAGNLARALQTPDSTPTANSDNLVTSGGVAAALAEKMDDKTIDSTPANNSDHLVSSKGVYDAIDDLRQDTDHYLEGKQDALTFDTTPTANSTNPVTSGGVKAALDTYSQAIMWPLIPLDISTLDYNRVYTVVVNNMTGDPMSVEDAFDMTNLPSSENRIIFNQPMGSVEIEIQEEFGLRIIRTQSGIYAFYDGKLEY